MKKTGLNDKEVNLKMKNLFACSNHFVFCDNKKRLHVVPYGAITGIDTKDHSIHLFNNDHWELHVSRQRHPKLKPIDKKIDKICDTIYKLNRKASYQETREIKIKTKERDDAQEEMNKMEGILFILEINRLCKELDAYLEKIN